MKNVPRPVVRMKIGGGKVPLTFASGDGAGHASVCAVDLFASSGSDEETVPHEPR
jgi:hypothetical protein